ncbi:MAG: ABC transporter ATP-binding protein, partial [Rhodobacteraceae bacterium]|nr:ABC transporter ATP-binding protein [Paracoccaceae bacterium]
LYGGLVVEEADVRAFFRAPVHAYSRALLAATPRHSDPDADLTPVPEAVIAAVQDQVLAADRSWTHA